MAANVECKPVLFTARMGPNFLWHMLAVARISYDSDYADRRSGSVTRDGLERLRAHARLLRFGLGSASPLTSFFTFLPAWLRLETKVDFARYFRSAERSLAEGTLRVFIEDFPQADWLDPFFHHFCIDPDFRPDQEMRRASAALAPVYLESFDAYREAVWPEAVRAMQPRIEELSEFFEAKDYILLWEKALGIEFETPSYEIMLCYASKNGPDANSLGYGSNLFYYDRPFARTWQLVSHEIGTHLLFDLLMSNVGRRHYDQQRLGDAYEVFVMFLNRRVLGLETLAYDLGRRGNSAVLEFCETTFREGTDRPEFFRTIADRFCRA